VDPVVGPDVIYLYGDEQIFILNKADGTPVGNPIRDVSSPPAVIDGRLYYGDFNNMLIGADARTGRAITRLNIGAVITAAPAWVGGRIMIGTDTGVVLVIHPDGLR
jgi:outer membrane protein assembly factor BamB